MADRDDYRGYGHDTGRYAERGHFERDRSGGRDDDRMRSGGGRDRDWRADRGRDDDDRGFFERAGEQVRSWFEDDEDHGHGRGGSWRENRWGANQRSGGMSGGSFRDQDRYRGQSNQGRQSQPWGSGDRGGDTGRGYSTGRYGSGGGAMGGSGDYRGDRDFGGDRMSDRARGMGSGYGAQGAGMGRQGDDHYQSWRQQQIDALDRDYDEYRNESRQKFHSEFGQWRDKRQQQRQHLGQVREHMDVVGSDGEHVGTVDKVTHDRIILTRNDANAGGHHHSIPCSWIQSVDERVTIDRSADDARRQWRDEENRRALFERPEDRSNDGPHILDRSFSGTYDRNDNR